MKPVNILFAVCHPDDEALWVGGLMHGLSKFAHVNVYVICLSGVDERSARPEEFEAARRVAGYKAGVIMGGPLRAANQPLPPVLQTFSGGLDKLGLSFSDIDVLITHSPFGEEHMHPHHVQASTELYEIALQHKIPFGYFSCIPLPTCRLQPILKNMKRSEGLQLLNYAHCQYSYLQKMIRWYEKKTYRYPHIYTQWLVDSTAKNEMLDCYQSIDLAMHRQAYAMFNNNVESLYLFGRRGARVFEDLQNLMEIPGSVDYFPGSWTDSGILRKLRNKFFTWKT